MPGDQTGPTGGGVDDPDGFTSVADDFILAANQAMPAEPAERVAAAFLYACARYNAFAMQTQGDAAGGMAEATVAYLVDDFASKLREHMAGRVTHDPGAGPPPRENPVVVATRAMRDFDEPAWDAFLDLADRFIDVANGLIRTHRASRISAAFMYGCARFCTFVLQAGGYPAEVDEAAVTELRDVYEAMLRAHAAEQLVRPQG